MANEKISQLAVLTTPANGDLFVAVDVSDTTMAPSGTDKQITWANIVAAITGGLIFTPTSVPFANGSGLLTDDGIAFSYNTTSNILTAGSYLAKTALLLEESGVGTDTITLQAPASIVASYALTLPADDGTSGQVMTTDGSGVLSWTTVGTGDGDVVGPASATDDAITRFNGTTGKLIQNSIVILNDSGIMSGLNQVNVARLQLFQNIIANLNLNENLVLVTTGTGVIFSDHSFKSSASFLYQVTGGGTNTIALKAPSSIVSSLAFTLPATLGSTGQVLTTSGGGVMAWGNPISGGDVDGPPSATNKAIARFDGITGKLIQNCLVTIGDAGIIDTPADQIKFDGVAVLFVPDGDSVVGVGQNSFISLTSSTSSNTGVGTGTGQNTTTGTANCFFGVQAGFQNTTGSNNCFFGSATGIGNTTGTGNTFIGDGAGGVNTSGNYNVAVGYGALLDNIVGIDNVCVGNLAGENATTGQNTMVGGQSGSNVNVGTLNNFFGTQTGLAITSGSKNTFIGSYTDGTSAAISNSIAIGHNTLVVSSNQLAIGSPVIGEGVLTQLTVGPAGSAATLPARPNIYLNLTINGFHYVVPLFAVS